MKIFLAMLMGLVALPACVEEPYPLAEFYGATVSFRSASVNGFTLTSTNQDVDGRPTRIESPSGFTFVEATEGAHDRDTGQSEIVASLDGELVVYVNDSGGSVAFAIDFLPRGQGQDCGSGCVSWMGVFQGSAWISGTAEVVNGNLELQQFNNGAGSGLSIEALTGLVMNSLTLAR